MIHSLHRPACYADLRDTLRFQRRLLELIADTTTVLPLTEPAMTAYFSAFGPNAGVWIANKPKTLCKDLEKAIKAAQRAKRRARTLLDDFDHDIQFDTKVTDTTFVFRFCNPTTPLEKAVKVLMNNLYKEVFGSNTGFNYGGTFGLTREEFVRAFVVANPHLEVCPVCDRSNDDANRHGTPSHTIDHFFPEAKFPFLSVHPANFLPACSRCNSIFKGIKQPVLQSENLTDTYHPYNGVLPLSVMVNRNLQGTLVVVLKEQSSGKTTRVQNYIRIFDMESRWERREKRILSWLCEHVTVKYRHLPKRTATLTPSDLDYLFTSLNNHLLAQQGKSENSFLKLAYLAYAGNQLDEKKKLIAAVVPNPNPPNVSITR